MCHNQTDNMLFLNPLVFYKDVTHLKVQSSDWECKLEDLEAEALHTEMQTETLHIFIFIRYFNNLY